MRVGRLVECLLRCQMWVSEYGLCWLGWWCACGCARKKQNKNRYADEWEIHCFDKNGVKTPDGFLCLRLVDGVWPYLTRTSSRHYDQSPSTVAGATQKPSGDKQGYAYKPPYGMWATLLYREMYLRWTYDYCAYFSTGLLFLFSLSPWGERVLNSTWWKLSRQSVGNLFTEELLRQITSMTRSMRVDATGVFILFLNTWGSNITWWARSSIFFCWLDWP